MKLVRIHATAANAPTIRAIAETKAVRLLTPDDDSQAELQLIELLVSDEKLQAVLDRLQTLLSFESGETVMVISLETALPKPGDEERRDEYRAIALRETLLEQAEKNARLDSTYLILVVLSTVVAAIGLLENNVAVVIGAMVIAPLLGPNLALGLGSALGDTALMRQALLSGLTGLSLALGLCWLMGYLLPVDANSHELAQRTVVGMDSVALALASGAAAALSLTTGLASVLVGVMVAVALLPPTAAFGLLLGGGFPELAMRAALLLAVNVVAVNLAAKLVFLARGIKPRIGSEQRLARQSMRAYLLAWLLTLALLVAAILLLTRT